MNSSPCFTKQLAWRPSPFSALVSVTLLTGLLATLPGGLKGGAADLRVGALRGQPRGLRAGLYFEANQGQTDQRVKYLSRSSGGELFLTTTEAVLRLRPPGGPALPAIRLSLSGANPSPEVSGVEPLPGQSNYLLGPDQQQWRTQIPHYAKVRYREVYPGVDLIFYGHERQFEYDFVLAPGADPARIRLAFAGSTRLSVNRAGELLLETPAGPLRQPRPVAYQEVNGERREVAVRYALSAGEVRFELGAYDRGQSLVIDPVLVYASYLGGSSDEFGNAVEVDAAGNAYVAGISYAANFPTKNPLQATRRGQSDAFLAKFDPAGQLIYATYLGGLGDDIGFAVTADAAGNAYLAGNTDASSFPTTPGTLQTQGRGNLDTFVAKVNPTGSALVYCTLLGGADDDVVNSVALDAGGNLYLGGQTLSNNFPSSGGALQTSLKGVSDAYVAKLNPNGSALVYATLLGGSAREAVFGLAVDATGNAYLTGSTSSPNFPVMNPVQANFGGRIDAFVAKLNPAGSALVYSTLLGGPVDEAGYGIGVDSGGNAYVAGFTSSTNFPVKSAFQATNAGGEDAFVLKLDASGSLIYSSYLGGSADERAFDLGLDAAGNVYFGGSTESANFPLKDPLQSHFNSFNGEEMRAPEPGPQSPRRTPAAAREAGRPLVAYAREAVGAWVAPAAAAERTAALASDAFLTKVSAGGTMVYSTYLGGNNEDTIYGVAADRAGNVYLTGLTLSTNFPVKAAAQGTLRGAADAFLVKLTEAAAVNKHQTVSAAGYTGTVLAAQEIVAAFGVGLADATQVATSQPLPTNLAGVSVKLRDSAGSERLAPLFFVSPNQINYLIPVGTLNGQALGSVLKNEVVVSTETVQIATLAPGLFSADATGQGVAAAVVLRVRANGSQVFEPVASFNQVLRQVVAVPIDLGPAGEQVYLVIFGTGLRGVSSLAGVSVSLGGVAAQVSYAGPQGQLAGLDQVNALVPRSLAGRGEVELVVSVDGNATNKVKVRFK